MFLIREQIANPYRGFGLSRLPVCRVGYGTDLSTTNSKLLPGLILRLLKLTPIRLVGASFIRQLPDTNHFLSYRDSCWDETINYA